MRALVTGATGFLGAHLTAALQARGDGVVGLGRDPIKVRALAARGIETVQVDLRDQAAVSRVCSGIDVVFHAGALSTPWGRYPDFYATNVTGTEHVIEACVEHQVSRLVYVSSPGVTFHNRDQFDLDESMPYPTRYLSPYCSTKKLAEDLVNAARDRLEVVILRPKAMFGPGDKTLLPRVIAAARRGRLPQIGDGSNVVDLTYVENVVFALLLAATSPAAVGRTYYITNGEHVPLWPLLQRVLALCGCHTLSRVPFTLAYAIATFMELRARSTGVEPILTRYTVAILGRSQTYNIAAARRDLGYAPRLSVEEGVRATLADLGVSE